MESRTFILTSAPEDEYLSIHVCCPDDFGTKLSKVLGCEFSEKDYKTVTEVSRPGDNINVECDSQFSLTIRKVLPTVILQTTPGNPKDNVFYYDVAILIGVGDGIVPFASILKSIWYRMNCQRETLNLQKVYFFWLCHDFQSYEWFRSILLAIEFQDMDSLIEIYPVSNEAFRSS